MERHPPPPTRFSPGSAQRRPQAPPPTRYGAAPLQPAGAALAAGPRRYAIPPTKYGAGAALPKPAAVRQAAAGAAAPRLARAAFPAPPPPVIQRMEDRGGRSGSNIFTYTSLGQHYTQEEIEQAQQEALGQNVHGHRSGNTTSKPSSQTDTEVTKVVEVLHKNKEKKKKQKEREKRVIKEESKKSDFWKALHKLPEFRALGLDGSFKALEAYLANPEKERNISEDQQGDLFYLLSLDDKEFKEEFEKLT